MTNPVCPFCDEGSNDCQCVPYTVEGTVANANPELLKRNMVDTFEFLQSIAVDKEEASAENWDLRSVDEQE